jgi:hypothetical protein
MDTILKTALILTALAAATLGSASYAIGATFLDLGYSLDGVTIAELKTMEGKRVVGKNRELIGRIGKVDEKEQLVELKTTAAAIVSLSVDALVKDGDRLAAPSLSRGDILAMVDRPADALKWLKSPAEAPQWR